VDEPSACDRCGAALVALPSCNDCGASPSAGEPHAANCLRAELAREDPVMWGFRHGCA
jgi:hypothetical protein